MLLVEDRGLFLLASGAPHSDRWIDNVFIERLWRSLKYEDIYLKDYADGREARPNFRSFDLNIVYYQWFVGRF